MNDRLPYREEGEQAEVAKKTFSVCFDCKWCRHYDKGYGKHASLLRNRENYETSPTLAACGLDEKLNPGVKNPVTGTTKNPPMKRVDCVDKNKAGECKDFERYEAPSPWWRFWK